MNARFAHEDNCDGCSSQMDWTWTTEWKT